jgi:hypothetical protein
MNEKIYCQKIKRGALRLRGEPLMPWSDIWKLSRDLRLVEEGMNCPTFEQFMNFFQSISFEECRNYFCYSFFLMQTYTTQNKSFGAIMEFFVRNETDDKSHKSAPIPGVPPKVYSLELWRVVKKIYFLRTYII